MLLRIDLPTGPIDLFPTTIFRENFSENEKIIEEITPFLENINFTDESPSNVNMALRRHAENDNNDNLIEEFKLEHLNSAIDETFSSYIKEVYEIDSVPETALKKNSWATKHVYENHIIPQHSYPASFVSVFYFPVVENKEAGGMIFTTPVSVALHGAPYRPMNKKHSKLLYSPVQGDIIICPSWLNVEMSFNELNEDESIIALTALYF